MKAISLDFSDNFSMRFKVDADGCWIWKGAKDGEGYGILNIDGEKKYAHRLAYQFFIGPMHHWQEIDHLCRKHACCNPSHLEAVTSYENSIRGNHPLFTAHREHRCCKGHDLTNPDNVHKRNDGRLRCKICTSAYQRDRRKRLKCGP